MSRLDDLIIEYCPNGVEYRTVGDAVNVVSTAKGIQRSNYGQGSIIPIVDQGQSLVAGFTDDESLALPEAEYIVFGDHTRAVKWVDFAFAPGADGTKVLRSRDGLISKFVYYAISALEVQSRGYNRHWTVLRELRIPLPPLDVQREIVQILDTFTALEAELEAELEARRRQYAHYRDALIASSQGQLSLTLGELGVIYGGLTGKSKADFNARGNSSFVTYVDVFGGISTVAGNGRVEIKPGERQNQVRRGDILFTASSESVEEVGMSSAVTREPSEPLYLNSFCFGFRPHDWVSLNPEFAKHLFRSEGIRRQIVRTASGVTRFNVSKERFRRVMIPLPSPEEQLRLAASLDRFDALANDLSIGLPAELAARRKQYEYYRDRLLSFEEAVS